MLSNILQFLMSRGAGGSTANESDPPAAEADADGSAGAQESAPQSSPLSGLLQHFFNRSGNQQQSTQQPTRQSAQQPGRGGFPPQAYGQRQNGRPSSKQGQRHSNVSPRGNGMQRPLYPPQGQYPAPYGYGPMMPPAQVPGRYGNRMNANANRQGSRRAQQSPMAPYGGFGGSGMFPGANSNMNGFGGQPGLGLPLMQNPNPPRGYGQPPYPQNRQPRNQRRGTPPYNPWPL